MRLAIEAMEFLSDFSGGADVDIGLESARRPALPQSRSCRAWPSGVVGVALLSQRQDQEVLYPVRPPKDPNEAHKAGKRRLRNHCIKHIAIFRKIKHKPPPPFHVIEDLNPTYPKPQSEPRPLTLNPNPNPPPKSQEAPT